MRLKSIELKNYRCYQHFKVDFAQGINAIAGVNGSGKTSLLKGIREALALNVLQFGLPVPNFHGFSDGDDNPAYLRADVVGNRWRFEPQHPVRIVANGEILGRACTWTCEKNGASGPVYARGTVPTALLLKNQSDERHPLIYPLFAYYPAHRAWPATAANEVAAATLQSPRAAGYAQWWNASADSSALQQWAITKSMERLQFATDRHVGWEGVDDDELAVVNQALRAVLHATIGLRYDFAQKSLVIERGKERPPTPYRNLSDGQRVAIGLVADMARRMALLNPHLGPEVITQTPGVVLIDELDDHLHPTWQRLTVRGLAAAFPKVQFIVTSHSPQVLSELRPENIILLTLDGAARPQASYGLDENRVLEQLMGVAPRPLEVENGLSELFRLIEQNDLSQARNALSQLRSLAPGLPEFAGAEALIRRKEVLGK